MRILTDSNKIGGIHRNGVETRPKIFPKASIYKISTKCRKIQNKFLEKFDNAYYNVRNKYTERFS
jgi:hypothetical protein